MARPVLRHWCGQCAYPDRATFLLGTVQAESELEALRALEELWRKLSPHPPPSIAPIPGMLAFREEA